MDIRVHTDDVYRLRDNVGPALQSSRIFNADNCITPNDDTYSRNIISSQVVQPYTKKLNDGACDYDIARNAELKNNNLNYYNRAADSSDLTNSALNTLYNVTGSGGLLLPELDTTDMALYNPDAYGNGNYSQSGMGGTGNANAFNQHIANHETYVGPPQRNAKYSNVGTDKTLAKSKSNFGEFNELQTKNVFNPTHYTSPDTRLSYQNVGGNHNAQLPSAGGMKSLQFREQYKKQGQPQNGFFF